MRTGVRRDSRRTAQTRLRGLRRDHRQVSWTAAAPRRGDAAKRWLSFLSNHREVLAAMDFFTVPTLTFRLLYCFFVIGHDRRKVLHFNVPLIPPPTGSCSNCGTHFLTPERIDTSCLTTTPNSMPG